MPKDVEIIQFLEEHDALSQGNSPWPSTTDQDQLVPIDYDSIFHSGQATDGPGIDPLIELLPTDLLALADDMLGQSNDILGQDAMPDGPDVGPTGGYSVPASSFDVLAWYQPVHFFGPEWGIYIKQEAIVDLAKAIALFYPSSVSRIIRKGRSVPQLDRYQLAAALIRAGFSLLFLHEHYHHKVESFSIRLHVVEQTSRFLPYHKDVYQANVGKSTQLEESLANADAYSRLDEIAYQRVLGKAVTDATKRFAEVMFETSPPGYKEALSYLKKSQFLPAENILQERVQTGTLAGKGGLSGWNLATQMIHSMFSVKNNIWEIVPVGSRSIFNPGPIAPISRPSTPDLDRLLRQSGYTEVPGRGKGSHKYYEKNGALSVCVPNGRERVSYTVLRQVCNALGIANLHSLHTAITSS